MAKIKLLRAKADALFQAIVKREHPYCDVCGRPTQLAHHFFSKGSSAELRYDLHNAVPLCSECHSKHHDGTARIGFAYIRCNEPWFRDLARRKSIIRRRNREYYEGVIKMLEER